MNEQAAISETGIDRGISLKTLLDYYLYSFSSLVLTGSFFCLYRKDELLRMPCTAERTISTSLMNPDFLQQSANTLLGVGAVLTAVSFINALRSQSENDKTLLSDEPISIV